MVIYVSLTSLPWLLRQHLQCGVSTELREAHRTRGEGIQGDSENKRTVFTSVTESGDPDSSKRPRFSFDPEPTLKTERKQWCSKNTNS